MIYEETNLGREVLVINLHTRPGQRVSAYALANTLVALADAARDANEVLNRGYSIQVVVQSVDEGSLRLRVESVYKGLGNLFSRQDVRVIVLGVVANYVYNHIWHDDINVTVESNMVVIEHDNERIVVSREVHEAEKKVRGSERFKRSADRLISSMASDDAIEAVSIETDTDRPERLPVIPREEMIRAAIGTEPAYLEGHHDMWADLDIIKAILVRGRRRWEFVWNGNKISAPVLDDKFYDAFFHHSIRVAPGDRLEALVRVYFKTDPDTGVRRNRKYEVLQVVRHVSRDDGVSTIVRDPSRVR